MENVEADDLGFVPTTTANLFELFNSQQKPGATTAPVLLESADATKDGGIATTLKAAVTPGTETPAAAAEGTQAAATTPANPEEDAEKAALLKNMITESVLGKKPDAPAEGTQGTGPAPDNQPAPTDNPLVTIYENYAEKGILKKVENFDGTDEGFDNVVMETVREKLDDAVTETITEAMEKHPQNIPIVKDLISFLGKGGMVQDFVATRRHEGIDATILEDAEAPAESKLKVARTIVTSYLQAQNWDADRINRSVQRLEARGPDAVIDEAKDYYPEYKKVMDARKAAVDESLTTQATKRQQEVETLNTAMKTTLDSVDNILGYDLKSKAAKDKFNDYLYKPTVMLDGKKVPQYYADRIQQQNTPEFQLALGTLMFNKFKINTAPLETKVTSTLKEKLSNMQKGKSVTTAAQGTDNKHVGSEVGAFEFDDDASIINLTS